jgi:hypothetical protein
MSRPIRIWGAGAIGGSKEPMPAREDLVTIGWNVEDRVLVEDGQ